MPRLGGRAPSWRRQKGLSAADAALSRSAAPWWMRPTCVGHSPSWSFMTAERRVMPARDFVVYAGKPPAVTWPGGARLALSLVVNVEEGAEPSPADGDPRAESRGEMPHQPRDGMRDLAIESQYEYGSRAGIWRILETLREYGAPATFFACGRA